MATTCKDFSRRVEESLAAIIRNVETAMARENVAPDVRTQLRGQLSANSSFQSVGIGEVFRGCTSSDWHVLYHRMQLAILDRKQGYEDILEDEDRPQETYIRFGGSLEAMRFLYATVDGIKAKIVEAEAADRKRREEEAGITTVERPCLKCLIGECVEGEDHCVDCLEHGGQEAARRRVERKRELRRQEAARAVAASDDEKDV